MAVQANYDALKTRLDAGQYAAATSYADDLLAELGAGAALPTGSRLKLPVHTRARSLLPVVQKINNFFPED